MSKNPIIPYAITAILGVLLVIIISYVGVNQREAIENPEEAVSEEEANEEGEAMNMDAEEVYKNSCANCHGADLTGESAPDLTEVGSRLSKDEIEEIIIHGTDGGMPEGLVEDEQAEALAEWLAEMN
ncbi:MAG TPA: cytochrome c [Virgibacillus sp.]|nr:cytochrome c [Virgibacillus sp.]